MIPGTTKKIRGWPISPKIGHRSSSRMNKKTLRGTWTVFVYLFYEKSILQKHSRSHNIHVWHIYLDLGCFNGIVTNITNPSWSARPWTSPTPQKREEASPRREIVNRKHWEHHQNTKNKESGITNNGLWITKITSLSILIATTPQFKAKKPIL